MDNRELQSHINTVLFKQFTDISSTLFHCVRRQGVLYVPKTRTAYGASYRALIAASTIGNRLAATVCSSRTVSLVLNLDSKHFHFKLFITVRP